MANWYHFVARRIVRMALLFVPMALLLVPMALLFVPMALAPAQAQASRCGLPFWADCRYGRHARGIDRRANTSIVFPIVCT